MFNCRTLFILGAGASAEANFPTGADLARGISERLDFRFDPNLVSGDEALYQSMQRTFQRQINEYIAAARRIRDGVLLSNSIDDFLDIHSDDGMVQLVGKAAIVRSILKAERRSTLFVDRRQNSQSIDLSAVKDSWYVKFMHMLGSSILRQDIEKLSESVSFIVFNYDRCLEHFLFHALQQLYGLTAAEAVMILRKFTIIHPYGSVAELQTSSSERGHIPFGGFSEDNDDYVRLASSIKTYTEQIEDDSGKIRIKDEMIKAECTVFLGFAFHRANMELLNPGTLLPQRRVFATAFGISQSNADAIYETVNKMVTYVPRVGTTKNPFITIDPQATCRKLLDDYQRAIIGV